MVNYRSGCYSGRVFILAFHTERMFCEVREAVALPAGVIASLGGSTSKLVILLTFGLLMLFAIAAPVIREVGAVMLTTWAGRFFGHCASGGLKGVW